MREKRGVAAIVGSELTFEDGARIVLLVENERGYAQHLPADLSGADARPQRRRAACTSRISTAHNDGLIALSGGPCGRVERALERGSRAAAEEAAALAAIFDGRFYLELQQHLTAQETQRNLQLVRLAQRVKLPYVATNGDRLCRRRRRAARRRALLRARRHHGRRPRVPRTTCAPTPSSTSNRRRQCAASLRSIPKRSKRPRRYRAALPLSSRTPGRTVSALPRAGERFAAELSA